MRFNDSSRFLDEISDSDLEASITLKKKAVFNEPKILGNFKKLDKAKMKALAVAPEDFKPNDKSEIKVGQTILHMKFGEGKVLSIDERKVATIRFSALNDSAEKRIMLDFARLQILEK